MQLISKPPVARGIFLSRPQLACHVMKLRTFKVMHVFSRYLQKTTHYSIYISSLRIFVASHILVVCLVRIIYLASALGGAHWPLTMGQGRSSIAKAA